MDFKRFRFLAAKVLDLDEGVKPHPYLDSKGLWTIGRGHCIGRDLTQLYLPMEAIEAIFEEDLVEHLDFTIRVFGKDFFNSLDEVRQIGLFSLCFNMGNNIFSFKTTIGLIKEKKWPEAAANLRVSKWAKDVDPRRRSGVGRDDRVIMMLEHGLFAPDYKL